MSACENSEERDGGTILVLLGTMGGSRMAEMRAAPSQVIVVNGSLYVIDCGSGVARQLALAGYNLRDLKCVFITHHHNDHNLDYGAILSLAQTEGPRGKVETYGPPPLKRMTEQFIEWHDFTERRSPFPVTSMGEMVDAHELSSGGPVMEDENVRVTSARVIHPPCEDSYAFRFDTEDTSITLSGDTAPSTELIKLARGSDVLVHEVYYEPFIEFLAARLPRYKGLLEWFPTAHTTAEDAGKIAQEAGVKTLVLSHFVPGDHPMATDEIWAEGAGKYFKGQVIVGRDLLAL